MAYKGDTKLSKSGCLGGKSVDAAADVDLGPLLRVEECGGKLKVLLAICFRFYILLHHIIFQLHFMNGSPRPQAFTDFAWDKSNLSKKFRKAKNAQEFVSIWKNYVFPHINQTTGKFLPSSSKRNESLSHTPAEPLVPPESAILLDKPSTSSATKRPPSSTPTMVLPKRKKTKLDDSDNSLDDSDKNIETHYSGWFIAKEQNLIVSGEHNVILGSDRCFA